MTEFEGAVRTLAQALAKRGYQELTPVQQEILDPELTMADVLVSAQTGSGKTIAFGLAIASQLLDGEEQFSRVSTPIGLIIAPTRELAMQVKSELQWLYAETRASFASCVGGMNMRDERRALDRGAHIVVGTPGRLRDHIERGSFDASGLRAVVLDEADQMLDLGFRDDLEYILESSPSDRRTLMFSATVPRSIETLAKSYQRNAVRVSITAEQTQHIDIDYRALIVASNDVENAIVNVLRYSDAKNALVFCGTRAAVNRMTSRFNNRGFSVVSLSGELSQNERTHALQAMRDGRARVCIATDVAARGIDLPNLDLVIHAEIPKNRETLLHRSGRTGRAGRKGTCALIVPPNWRKRTERLLKSADIDATWERPPTADDIMRRDQERLLSHPSLKEALNDTEKTFVAELLAQHRVEHIAAAFIRQYFAEQAAPEELIDIPLQTERGRRSHDDFGDGVWFALSVGRDQSAEPRWLLPSLCHAGQVTSKDIGAIRVQPNQTYVQIRTGVADQFLEALGPDARLEKTISVTRLDAAPEMSGENRNAIGPRAPRGSGRSEQEDRPKKKGYPKGKPATTAKSGLKRKSESGANEAADTRKPQDKPWDKPPKKSKKKNPNKGNRSKNPQAHSGNLGPKDRSRSKTGSAPLKREKPKST